MKRIRSYLLVLSMLFATEALQAQPLYVGEFNIRNDNAKDAAAGNGWAVRCPVVCDILKVESFDIFGQGFCPEEYSFYFVTFTILAIFANELNQNALWQNQ